MDTPYQSGDLQNRKDDTIGQNVSQRRSSEPIDTSKLTTQLDATLKAQNINRQFFANEFLSRPVVALDNMAAETVKKWSVCSRTHRKVQEFLDSKSSQRALKAKQSKRPKVRRSRRLLFKSRKTLPSKILANYLDTVNVANRLRNALSNRNITLKVFVASCMGSTSRQRISKMLKKPIQWKICSGYEKKLYRKMHDWLVSEEGSF
jgi:hypothetical protein